MTYNNNAVTTTYPAVTDRDIDALEQRIGEKLPPELRQHYLENNGGQLTHRECQSADGIDFHLHEFLPIVGPNRGFDLAFDVARRDPGFMPNNLLPFAIDEGGAYFCLRRPDGHVIFFNPENADNLDWAIMEVAPSLKDFIEGMS